MKRKYLYIIIVVIALLAGISLSIIEDYYPLSYLYNIIINRGLQINPEVKIDAEREYNIKVWYYPLFKTVDDKYKMEEIFVDIKSDINKKYPNINLQIQQLSFLKGRKKLIKSFAEGNTPDIYFNISTDNWINRRYQIPVEWYINEEEKAGYYTVNWDNIDRKNHLWGFPYFIAEQFWVSNVEINTPLAKEEELLKYIEKEEDIKIFYNVYDKTLLRQLLSLFGMRDFILTDNKVDEESRRYFEEMYTYLSKLRTKNRVLTATGDSMLKKLINEDNIIAGPINPWLHIFINKKQITRDKIYLNRYQSYCLNVFRQKNYKGDDHTKAVMEVAKYISRYYAHKLAAKLKLKAGYKIADYNNTKNNNELIQLSPSEQKYWQQEIIPAWIDFWEKDLTVEQVMEKF